MKAEPHSSHKMSEWESAIVTIIVISRFGSIRRCINCGAEQVETAAGHSHHAALTLPCSHISHDELE
jgi:hypothetical protein